MALRICRFITLLLAALSLTMESAHVLELPQKMQYDARMYASVNATLYLYFAIIGGFWQVSSIVMAAILVYLVRKRHPAFTLTLVGALCLLAAFAVWLIVVEPVNSQIGQAMQASPGTVPELWMQLRARWEYGHAIGFVLQLIGYCALLLSVVAETPREHPALRL
jgi:formate hydrogenlyase subunit 4